MDCKKCKDLGFDDNGAECPHCMYHGDAYLCDYCGMNPVDFAGDICVWCQELDYEDVNNIDGEIR